MDYRVSLPYKKNVYQMWRNKHRCEIEMFDCFFFITIKVIYWLFWGLTALQNSISVYIGPSPREREKEERKDRGE